MEMNGGVYLVIDLHMAQDLLLEKLESALRGGLAAVQIWDGVEFDEDMIGRVREISALCATHGVPCLINNRWELIDRCGLQGVHFDGLPADWPRIKSQVKKAPLCGITCTNSIAPLQWAIDHRAGYISFCAMFPSASAGSCEIVMPESVKRARAMTAIPLFVSGGITPENTRQLRSKLDFDGVAVISGIMNATDPEACVRSYRRALHQTEKP
ncbi:MAG: thiamine phosphate synthase [Mucilaginibacter polytrichastri]|nr:thiamine phosphate synthase [Mucilaginibacter polytrichastri]